MGKCVEDVQEALKQFDLFIAGYPNECWRLWIVYAAQKHSACSIAQVQMAAPRTPTTSYIWKAIGQETRLARLTRRRTRRFQRARAASLCQLVELSFHPPREEKEPRSKALPLCPDGRLPQKPAVQRRPYMAWLALQTQRCCCCCCRCSEMSGKNKLASGGQSSRRKPNVNS